jgi:transposase
VQRRVPDGLWELAQPLMPSQRVRPQGGGTRARDARTGCAAVVFVLTSGSAWRHLPPVFAVSPATAHRRFVAWTEAGLWRRLHQRVLDELGAGGQVDWARALCDRASGRKRFADRGDPGGPRQARLTAPRPVRLGWFPPPSPSPRPTPPTARPGHR